MVNTATTNVRPLELLVDSLPADATDALVSLPKVLYRDVIDPLVLLRGSPLEVVDVISACLAAILGSLVYSYVTLTTCLADCWL